jgi:hypothetical protein
MNGYYRSYALNIEGFRRHLNHLNSEVHLMENITKANCFHFVVM